MDDGVVQANVYGVEVGDYSGKAGMAALVVNERFDLERLHGLVHRELPHYARPLFLRIHQEDPSAHTTGTFKMKKTDLVAQGFDPAKIDEPLYLDDPDGHCVEIGDNGKREAGAADAGHATGDGRTADRPPLTELQIALHTVATRLAETEEAWLEAHEALEALDRLTLQNRLDAIGRLVPSPCGAQQTVPPPDRTSGLSARATHVTPRMDQYTSRQK